MDNPDNLLIGTERFQNRIAQSLLGAPLNKIGGDIVMDVRFEQCFTNLCQPVPNIRFGELPTAPQYRERGLQAVGDTFEHIWQSRVKKIRSVCQAYGVEQTTIQAIQPRSRNGSGIIEFRPAIRNISLKSFRWSD